MMRTNYKPEDLVYHWAGPSFYLGDSNYGAEYQKRNHHTIKIFYLEIILKNC